MDVCADIEVTPLGIIASLCWWRASVLEESVEAEPTGAGWGVEDGSLVSQGSPPGAWRGLRWPVVTNDLDQVAHEDPRPAGSSPTRIGAVRRNASYGEERSARSTSEGALDSPSVPDGKVVWLTWVVTVI
jgi:hypothetical protein